MPPWIWTAFWPTNLQALPTLALAAETADGAFGAVELQRRHQGDGDGLFDFHEHVDEAVLEHLEVADRLAELLALLGVIERRGVEHAGQAAGFGADGGGGFIDDLFDERQGAAGGADDMFGADRDIFEIDFRGGRAIDGRVIAAGDALQVRRDQQQRHAALVTLTRRWCGR